MPYETQGLRHDTEALFAKLEGEELSISPITPLWAMTPCVVIDGNHIHMARSAGQLLPFPDDAQVICGWPGAMRQDVFAFTVGAFRAAITARDHRGGDQPMTCDDAAKSSFKFALRQKARCEISGVEGVITGRYDQLSGVNRYEVTPLSVNGTAPRTVWIDEGQLVLVEPKSAPQEQSTADAAP